MDMRGNDQDKPVSEQFEIKFDDDTCFLDKNRFFNSEKSFYISWMIFLDVKLSFVIKI